MDVKLFFLLLILCLGVVISPGGIAAAPHDTAGHGAASAATDDSPPSPFDQKSALAVSQGVIGKSVGDYTLTTTDGRNVRLSDFRGKPLVISLVYTSCYHICPTTTQHLAQVVRTARSALGPDSFTVLTIGFDTPNDTPTAMRQFAQDQSVNIAHWDFLSTDAAAMDGLTKDLGFIYQRAPHGFDHLIQATMIDAQGKIYRQVYGMTFDTPILVEPLKELVFGAPSSSSLLTNLSSRIKLFCTVYDPATGRYRFDYSIFIEFFIGITFIGAVSFFLIREWHRVRQRHQG